MTPTPAILRALGAVRRGDVVREYRRNGNTLKGPKGVGRVALLAWNVTT